VAELLDDYSKMEGQLHFFSGMDDLTLTKVDVVQENGGYDLEITG